MNLKQAAEKLGCPQRKLIDELNKKFPGQTWKGDSDLPQEFIDAIATHANEYIDASSPTLPKGELTTTDSAVSDSRIVLEAIEYGILEALSDSKLNVLITTAHLNAVKDIQQYQNAYSEVWELYFNQEIESHGKRLNELSRKTKEMAIALNSDLSNRQGKLTLLQAQNATQQTDMRQQVQIVVNALLPQSKK